MIFKELFSDGMKTYNNIKHENAYKIIGFLRDGTSKYITEIGEDMNLLMKDCYSKFDKAFKAQNTLITIVKDNNPSYDANYLLMKKQLNIDLHTICLKNGDVPAENYIFFDDSVLVTPSHHKGKDYNGPWIKSIQPNTQIDSQIAFALGQKITINLSSI